MSSHTCDFKHAVAISLNRLKASRYRAVVDNMNAAKLPECTSDSVRVQGAAFPANGLNTLLQLHINYPAIRGNSLASMQAACRILQNSRRPRL